MQRSIFPKVKRYAFSYDRWGICDNQVDSGFWWIDTAKRTAKQFHTRYNSIEDFCAKPQKYSIEDAAHEN